MSLTKLNTVWQASADIDSRHGKPLQVTRSFDDFKMPSGWEPVKRGLTVEAADDLIQQLKENQQ